MGAGRVDPQKCARKRPRGAARVRAASLATQCTGELLRGGGGPRLCWVAARRNRCLGGTRHRQSKVDTSKTAFRTLLPQLIVPAHRKNLHRLAFLGMPGVPRVRRLVNPPPRRKNNSLAIPTSGPSFPQATETKNTVLRPRAKGDAGAVVTWCLSTHHTEAIRRMYNLIYRKG